jgi:antirestriction protein
MQTEIREVQVWVSSLQAYNNANGEWGAWIDITDITDPEEFLGLVKTEVLDKFGGEEWAIHDYDPDLSFGEYPDAATLLEAAQGYVNYGDAYLAYLSDIACGEPSESDFEERYQGVYDDEDDWAWQEAKEIGGVPEHMMTYIDLKKFASDLSGDYTTVKRGGKLYVFRD